MSIPYRTQQGLKRLAVVLLVLLLVAVLVWLCWLIWLNRFVTYTRDGAVLDMTQDQIAVPGEVALPPSEEETIPIYYNEGENEVQVLSEMSKVTGYYISASDLKKGDFQDIKARLRQLEPGTPVMLEIKDSFGAFYYSTSVDAPLAEGVDVAQVDDLIQYMNSMGLYTMVRLPALRDYSFGLTHTENGLFVPSGGYLWPDKDYRYWMNPTKTGTMNFLGEIAQEVKKLGFDEIVFCDFRFPDGSGYAFDGDKVQALATAAKSLVDDYASSSFAVSFEYSEDFTYPGGKSRVYVLSAQAGLAEEIAESLATQVDVTAYLVFITDLYDTRFDDYGVLRPLTSVI